MRQSHIQAGFKLAMESENEIKVDAAPTEDNRPTEPSTAENATAPEKLGDDVVKVDAPKENDDTRPDNDPIEPTDEGEIASAEIAAKEIIEEANTDVAEYEEIKASAAAMESYAVQLRHLIKTNTGTAQTARILKTAINNQLRHVSFNTPSVSLEAMATPDSIKRQHEKMLETVALEGDTLNRIAQGYIVNTKRKFDEFVDGMKTVRGQLKKYAARADAGLKEFEAQKSKFKGDKIRGHMAHVSPFFRNGDGPVKDVMGSLANDLAVSKYILVDYTAGLINLANSIAGIANSGDLSTPEGAAKVIAAIEKLPHPAEAFKSSFVGTPTFLNAMKLDIDVSKNRAPLEVGGKSYQKIASLATTKRVIESTAGSKLSRFADHVAGDHTMSSKHDFFLAANDIPKLFQAAKQYVEFVNQYFVNEDKAEHAFVALEGAIKKLQSTAKDSAGKKVAAYVMDFGFNIFLVNFRNPAVKEISRAIRGSRFCSYLGQRMVYNAVRTNSGQNQE